MPRGVGAGLVIGGDAAGDDEPDAGTGPLRVEGRHPGEAVRGLLQPDVHRAHEDSVGQGDMSEVERGEQVRVRGCRGHPFTLGEPGLPAGVICPRGWLVTGELLSRGLVMSFLFVDLIRTSVL